MNPIVVQILAGLAGGVVRGLVGVAKSQTITPVEFTFSWKYFAFTMLVSIVSGILAGLVINTDWRMSLLAGYAGADLLEGLYKLRFSQYFS